MTSSIITTSLQRVWVSTSFDPTKPGLGALSGFLPGFGHTAEHETSVTRSQIGTTNISITNSEGQNALNALSPAGTSAEKITADLIANLTTTKTTPDALNNFGALTNTYDKDKLQKIVDTQVAVMQGFKGTAQGVKTEVNTQKDQINQATKALNEDLKRAQAVGDVQAANQLQTQIQSLNDKRSYLDQINTAVSTVSNVLTAPSASAIAVAVNALAPAATYELGQWAKGNNATQTNVEGSALHLLGHAAIALIQTAANGGDITQMLVNATTTAGAEAAAPFLAQSLYGKPASELDATQKQTLSNILQLASLTASAGVSGATGTGLEQAANGMGSAVNTTQNAVENNTLTADEVKNVPRGVWTEQYAHDVARIRRGMLMDCNDAASCREDRVWAENIMASLTQEMDRYERLGLQSNEERQQYVIMNQYLNMTKGAYEENWRRFAQYTPHSEWTQAEKDHMLTAALSVRPGVVGRPGKVGVKAPSPKPLDGAIQVSGKFPLENGPENQRGQTPLILDRNANLQWACSASTGTISGCSAKLDQAARDFGDIQRLINSLTAQEKRTVSAEKLANADGLKQIAANYVLAVESLTGQNSVKGVFASAKLTDAQKGMYYAFTNSQNLMAVTAAYGVGAAAPRGGAKPKPGASGARRNQRQESKENQRGQTLLINRYNPVTVMPLHLLITPTTEQALSKTIQSLGRHYVRYFNDTYRHTGTLWEGRYKATLIDSEVYFLTCMRYIELNPVRAQMVTLPEEYPWSSFRSNALGVEDVLVSPHVEYRRLGMDAAARQAAYLSMFDQKMSERSLNEIREATNKAWVLGDDVFRARIEAQLNRRAVPLGRGGDRKSEAYRKIKGV